MKLLVIEDDDSLREIISESLKREHYVVEEAANYREAKSKLGVYAYECILLDINLPDGNGLQLLEQLKADKKQENVIIISARNSLDDKISGLELGADDYLTKPFHLAELSARIRSVVRRKINNGEVSISQGNVSISPQTFEVRVDSRLLTLSRKEYDILHFFALRPNRLVTKEFLAEAVWGDYIDQADNFDFVYAQMKNLRRKLRDAGASVEIKSVYGMGYKFVLL